MVKNPFAIVSSLALVVAVALSAVEAFGQSATRRPPAAQPSRSHDTAAADGSGPRDSAAGSQRQSAGTELGLEGYCPVCLRDGKKWVKGNPAYQAPYDGRIYYFMGDQQMQKFVANPDPYAPVMGGDCVVCYAKMGQRVPGKVQFSAYHQGRLYLFASAEQKQMFLQDPAAYANVDLALGGMCPVCRVNMKSQVAGNPKFSVTYAGLRYQFPSEQHRQMFLQSPEKYQVH